MKVAAYCRVSTDKSDQLNSLESQKAYFERYIKNHGNWEFVRVYADEGLSGTQAIKRPEFIKMIHDAADKRIELIITKEISRFARNTVDSLQYTRQLKSFGVGVVFINDNINTLDPDAELRLAIMSSIAQEEVRKISERVKWGHKRRMEQGVVFGHRVLGYDILNGKLVVNEEEAEIVRLIFHKYIMEGKGVKAIADELNDRGIKSRTKTTPWASAGIRYILRNEKYAGDLLQKKYVTLDYLSHKKTANKNHEGQVLIQNNHEAIIDRMTWSSAQEELARRNNIKCGESRYSNRHWFSGKIKCCECGASLHLKSRKMQHGVHKTLICRNAQMHGRRKINNQGEKTGCNSGGVNYKALLACVNYALIAAQEQEDIIISNIQKDFAEMIGRSARTDLNDLETKKIRAEEKIQKAVELHLNGEISINELRRLREKYSGEITGINNQIHSHENSQFIMNNEMDKMNQIFASVKSGGLLNGQIAEEIYRTSVEYINADKNNIGVKIKHMPFVIETYFEPNGKQGANYDVTVRQKDNP